MIICIFDAAEKSLRFILNYKYGHNFTFCYMKIKRGGNILIIVIKREKHTYNIMYCII